MGPAISIRFSAASQQLAATKAPSCRYKWRKRAGIVENIAIRAGECLGHMIFLMQAGVDRFPDDEDLGALGGSLQLQLVSTDR